MLVFFLAFGFVTLWQFLPEFVFPMLQSLAFLCWVAPENATANFVGSGAGGMGFMNLSLDWSTISTTYNLFLTPWWTQVIFFVAFVVNCWILIPAAKWGNLGSYDHGLMSNRLLRCKPLLNKTQLETSSNSCSSQRYAISYCILVGVRCSV
jgi:hypothetical protein